MNENIDLTKILKNCPKGTEFYSAVEGEVKFEGIVEGSHPIATDYGNYTKKGTEYEDLGECIFFPSKEQRDLIFNKMHEAGYELDAENKKLKKLLK